MAPGTASGRGPGAESGYRHLMAGQKAATRKRVLASARRIFLRDGFADTNLNEVAQLAGVGKGTLYRHFQGKGDLYLAMLAEHGENFTDELRSAIDPHAPVPKQLEQLAAHYLEFWIGQADYFQIIWAIQNRQLVGPLSEAVTRRLSEIFERPLRLLEGLIRAGIARGELRPCDAWNVANATALGANAIVGQIVMKTPQVVERDLRAVYRQFYELVIAGLVADPASDPT